MSKLKQIHFKEPKILPETWKLGENELTIMEVYLIDHPKKSPGKYFIVPEPDEQGRACIHISSHDEHAGMYVLEEVKDGKK